MLTRIYNIQDFRSFRAWSPTPSSGSPLRLGKDTMIYGRNGSGKSTFSEVLRLLSAGLGPCDVDVESDGTSIGRYRTAAPTALEDVYVFNAEYVRRNLSEFLDADGDCAPLIRLGESRIADAATKAELEARVGEIGIAVLADTTRASEADARAEATLQLAKTMIIDALGPYDGTHYNPQSYTVTKVKALYRTLLPPSLSDAERARELATLNSDSIEPVHCDELPAFDPTIALETASELLVRDVLSSPIEALVSSASLADWIEIGVELHSDGDVCKFCTNPLPSDLLAAYRSHFDKSQSMLKADLARFDRGMIERAAEWQTWLDALPASTLVVQPHREAYEAHRQGVIEAGTRVREWIESIRGEVAARGDSIFTPLGNSLATEVGSVDTTDLLTTLEQHEAARANLGTRRTAAAVRIEQHYAAISSAQYANEVAAAATIREGIDDLRTERERKERELGVLNAAQFDSAALARAIESDMATYFGHSQFKIRIAPDGDGYAVTRSGAPARHLSEGERNGVALLYFLRSLEIEGVDPAVGTVVVDDPVSSMDTEAIFAAQSLISERLEPFHQRIILTHDFEFFRLMLEKNKSKYRRSLQLLGEGNAAELLTPRVQFLEFRSIYSTDDGVESRTPELRTLSRDVLRFPTEYHYLFWRVAGAAFDETDADAPLMANAARRLVEGFLAFKAPNGANMKVRIDKVAERAGIETSLAERVYRFTNSLSHRDNPNPQVSLNFTGHRDELKMIFDFIRRADRDHFDDLVAATGVGPT